MLESSGFIRLVYFKIRQVEACTAFVEVIFKGDKLKNASILRKYGSICMDEKTKAFIRIIYSTVNVVTFIAFFVFS